MPEEIQSLGLEARPTVDEGERVMPVRKEEHPAEPRRKEIFLALVAAQDKELTVAQSRKLISEQFGVAENVIRDIEREGLDQQWPPL